ncbi:MAG: hypothetical protein IMW89_08600, partial [Ktedonobacteraceae bacterium]|nr:hypothetical protein [Ktedonobacteraceae bacterium]
GSQPGLSGEGASSLFERSLHGQALARDPWAEHYGPWIVFGFVAIFALYLSGMALFGQTPGQSVLLKSGSDLFQFAGECIGFLFCMRIATRLRRVVRQLHDRLTQRLTERATSAEISRAHAEVRSARRAFLAWIFLAAAIACYASGQAIWTSYDIRMNSADVPFPGIYDLGFVGSYPFFLIGTLLLTRRDKAGVGRVRLLLDATTVILATLSLSWFFVLGPSIAALSHAPSAGAAFLSVYFPTGDLFLVAIGAFLMFSPLSSRAQQHVFTLLCLGLSALALTDSLLGYFSLSPSGFNTGTFQDILWPLSMSLVGLAAIEYPRSHAREQEQAERAFSARFPLSAGNHTGRLAQLTMIIQTILPFVLALGTCALLLTVVAPQGGEILVQADLIALALIIVVVIRQSLTLMENNRLTMQIRGELVISRRELQVSRREADEAARAALEKRVLEEGVATLRSVHARVARGDFAARAPTIAGPLLPIAVSLNLMLDRLKALSERGARYDQLMREGRVLQEALARLAQGQSAFSDESQAAASAGELRPLFLGLIHLQRMQQNQWRRLTHRLEWMNNLTRRLGEALHELRHAALFKEAQEGSASFERMTLERAARSTDLLAEQLGALLEQPFSPGMREPQTVSSVISAADSYEVPGGTGAAFAPPSMHEPVRRAGATDATGHVADHENALFKERQAFGTS